MTEEKKVTNFKDLPQAEKDEAYKTFLKDFMSKINVSEDAKDITYDDEFYSMLEKEIKKAFKYKTIKEAKLKLYDIMIAVFIELERMSQHLAMLAKAQDNMNNMNKNNKSVSDSGIIY